MTLGALIFVFGYLTDKIKEQKADGYSAKYFGCLFVKSDRQYHTYCNNGYHGSCCDNYFFILYYLLFFVLLRGVFLSEIRISNGMICIHRFNLQFMCRNLQLCKVGCFELSEIICLVVATQSCGIVTIK